VRAVWIDARRSEIYGGVYSDALRALAPEVVVPMEQWLQSLPADATVLDGSGVALAGAVGRIAMTRYSTGERPDPAALDANYVRRSDAELLWKEPPAGTSQRSPLPERRLRIK
jgi:tRNA threonylcarbamoyladenosine biosynthesis protein TsaB